MSQWFEEWFDSPLYEEIYADRDQDEADRLGRLLEQLIPLSDFPEILDLGCGRGRHSLTLADKGYRVTGIDLSDEAIVKARQRAERRGLDEVDFEVRDMRKPLNRKFDAIVNLFTTFGYFEYNVDNAAVFDSVVAMLKPGGRLVMDYLNARKVRHEYKPSDEGELEGIQYRIRRYIESDCINKEITFTGEQVDGEETYTERVKLYELDWFKQEMEPRGLQVKETYGDYDGHPFAADESPRLLMVCELEQ